MQQQSGGLFDVHLDQPGFAYLTEAARWAKFISIIGFIFCVIFVLFGLFAGTIFATMGAALGDIGSVGGGFFTAVYIVIALMWFFPNLYLFRFASKIQQTVNNSESSLLPEALRNLKSYFKFLGILFIIILSFYALAIVGGIIATMAGGFS